ncbi:MAG: SPFH domain-containing protein [Phycisphaerales bacterium]
MIKGDHLAYRRAAMVSMLGLVIQTILTLLMFAYGKQQDDHAASSAVWILGAGILIWGVLVLVFDQQRRERLEVLEAEQLASSSAASSAFEATTDDMRVAGRRLATIQKWVVPLVSLIVAAIYLTGGLLRLADWRSITDPFNALPNAGGWPLSIGFGIAIVMFVFARFVSGMGTLKPWSNLRAGAASSVAASLIGLLIGAGSFIKMALSQDWLLLIVPYVIPVMAIVLACETVVHLVLDLYRPRTAGRDARPACDSRLLGLIAAPDRIAESVGEAVNYQFGVDITSSWFYQLIMRRIVLLLGMGAVIAWLLTMVVVVEPHQRGLVLSRGDISKPLVSLGEVGEGGDVGPGLHLKAPWPLQTFEIPTIETRVGGVRRAMPATAGVRVLQLASSPPEDAFKPILWTESHSQAEMLFIVQADGDGATTRDETAGGTAGSLSLVALEVPVQYVVRDFRKFDEFAGQGQRERMLTAIGRRVVTQYLSELRMGEVLSSGRTAMPVELKSRLEEAYGKLNGGNGAGIEIQFVGVNGVHPPVRVAPNFERTVIARQNREATIETALKEKTNELTKIAGSVDLAEEIADRLTELSKVRGFGTVEETELEIEVQRLLEEAGGEAGEMILAAGWQRWNRHMSERGRSALLRGQNIAYEAAPELFRTKRYFEALSEVMKNARVYLTPDDIESLHIRVELQDNEVGANVFDEQAGAELNQ